MGGGARLERDAVDLADRIERDLVEKLDLLGRLVADPLVREVDQLLHLRALDSLANRDIRANFLAVREVVDRTFRTSARPFRGIF